MRLREIKHRCDKCLKKTKTKRYALHKHKPYYDYIGFDLCSKCEKELIKFFNDFFQK